MGRILPCLILPRCSSYNNNSANGHNLRQVCTNPCFFDNFLGEKLQIENAEKKVSGKKKSLGKQQKLPKVSNYFMFKRSKNCVQCVKCESKIAYCGSTKLFLQHLSRKHLNQSLNRNSEMTYPCISAGLWFS